MYSWMPVEEKTTLDLSPLIDCIEIKAARIDNVQIERKDNNIYEKEVPERNRLITLELYSEVLKFLISER